MKPRRVTVQVEIIEPYENSGHLRLMFDGNIECTVYEDYRMYKGSWLFKNLREILQKYQPRGTIEGSVTSFEVETRQNQ